MLLDRVPQGKGKVSPAGVRHTSWPTELQSKVNPKEPKSLRPGEALKKEPGRVRVDLDPYLDP